MRLGPWKKKQAPESRTTKTKEIPMLSFDLWRNFCIKNVVLFEENSILPLPERSQASGVKSVWGEVSQESPKNPEHLENTAYRRSLVGLGKIGNKSRKKRRGTGLLDQQAELRVAGEGDGELKRRRACACSCSPALRRQRASCGAWPPPYPRTSLRLCCVRCPA